MSSFITYIPHFVKCPLRDSNPALSFISKVVHELTCRSPGSKLMGTIFSWIISHGHLLVLKGDAVGVLQAVRIHTALVTWTRMEVQTGSEGAGSNL